MTATWTHEEGLLAGAACLEAALSYSRLGWSVLCLCPPDHAGVGRGHGATCDRKHWGKRPVADGSRWKERQEKAATGAEIRAWWHAQPNANVGLALGPVSGLVRLDIEGRAAEERLLAVSGGDLPATLEFTSGRPGGRGLLYALPPGVEAKTGVEGLSDGELRIQGLGAQTVLPPSRHNTGRVYAWVAARGPTEIGAALAPAWLLERLKGGQRGAADPSLSEGELIPEGRRDTTLTSMAGVMRRRGFGEAAIRNALAAENLERCDPPLEDGQVEKIARSVARYEPDAYADVTVVRPSSNGLAHAQAAQAAALTAFGPPIPASMLKKIAEEAKWLWKGYVSRGGITLLSALWKAGKTTLLSYLLKAFEAEGFFCGTAVSAARVLYVTEEHEALWADRRDSVRFGDWVEFLVRPFGAKPDLARWSEFLSYLRGVCKERKYDLIVFDTISNLWPVRDENDAAKVQEALMPLRSVADLASFLLVHHLRKSDGAEATGSRGTGAFPAFCDTLLELRRFDATDRKDRRRVLSGVGRYRETPDEVVLEWSADLYRVLGDRREVRSAALHAVIMPELPASPPGRTADELYADWAGGKAPPEKELRAGLRAGAAAGFWVEAGGGHRGDPYRYWRPRSDS